MESAEEKYIREHCSATPEPLSWIEKQTNIHTNYPRMLSGPVQGRFLKMLVEMTGAKRVLEIGSFTGYSSCWMALGLPEDGIIDALEIKNSVVINPVNLPIKFGLIRSITSLYESNLW